MTKTTALSSIDNNAQLPRARARFLTQAIQLEEQGPSSTIRLAIFFTVLLLVSAVGWAAITQVDERTTARGEIIPAGHIHNVQHLEGGIVDEIEVRNGDQVKSGDLLLRLAPPATQSEYAAMLARKTTLALQQERLQAITQEHEPDFKKFSVAYSDSIGKQQAIYEAQLESQQSKLRVADAQIRQRKRELRQTRNQAKSIAKEIELLQQQVTIREKLVADKLVSRTELLSTQSNLATANSRQRTIHDSIGVARLARQEAIQRRSEQIARFKEELELEAGKVSAELAEVEQKLVRLRDRVDRLNVTAPVSGIVKGLTVTSINAVIEPGQVILQIVPVNDELILEAQISPQDIGHVHIGQAADVKIDSYDPARFGTVKGAVRQISASTYLDEKRNPYYRAEIELEKAYLGKLSDKLQILPGMTVQADIKTGRKSILDYLLKPVSRGFDTAFRER